MHPLAMSDTPPAFMQWLLDHGADANFCRDADDDPPLYHQVQAGNTEQAAVLLQNGANANYANEFGNTILHFAQTAPLVKLLLAHGANPAAKNRRGQTPFDSLLDTAPLSDKIADMIACTELYLQAGMTITEQQREQVAWSRDHYDEHMERFEVPHTPEGYAALRRLCEMFGVAPEPVREEPQPVPTAPIVLAGDTLWDQYTNGRDALVPPPCRAKSSASQGASATSCCATPWVTGAGNTAKCSTPSPATPNSATRLMPTNSPKSPPSTKAFWTTTAHAPNACANSPRNGWRKIPHQSTWTKRRISYKRKAA